MDKTHGKWRTALNVVMDICRKAIASGNNKEMLVVAAISTGALFVPIYFFKALYIESSWYLLILIALAALLFLGRQIYESQNYQAVLCAMLKRQSLVRKTFTGRLMSILKSARYALIVVPLLFLHGIVLSGKEIAVLIVLCLFTIFVFYKLKSPLESHSKDDFFNITTAKATVFVSTIYTFAVVAIFRYLEINKNVAKAKEAFASTSTNNSCNLDCVVKNKINVVIDTTPLDRWWLLDSSEKAIKNVLKSALNSRIEVPTGDSHGIVNIYSTIYVRTKAELGGKSLEDYNWIEKIRWFSTFIENAVYFAISKLGVLEKTLVISISIIEAAVASLVFSTACVFLTLFVQELYAKLSKSNRA